MDREIVITRLKAAEPQIRAHGVRALYLYGSHARDEAGPESDIDVLVDFETDQGIGLEQFMAPYHVLEGQFPGVAIGYGTRESLVPLYRGQIEKRAVRIF